MPAYSDRDRRCGPAALAAVLNFHGAGVSPGEAAGAVFREDLRGSLGLDLTLYARSLGYPARWLTGRPEELTKAAEAGLPLIVMLDRGLAGVARLHFIVAAGYGPVGVTLN
ncbi:MAG: cysteine peptidase family C39 domain-containing protein, partial [Thermodesulfobacteriota bacterium]